MVRVLLVEGDPRFREDCARQFAAEGMDVTTIAGAAEAQARWFPGRGGPPDAVLLAVSLPDGDGLAVLQAIRADPARRALPVLLLARSPEELDRALATDAGADDYLCLPVGGRELTARLRALLRRAAGQEADGRGRPLAFGPVELDAASGEARLDGLPLELTRRELELLAFFLQHPHQVLARERILQQVWGLGYLGESRTIDAHVRRLRAKLGASAGLIETLVGVGYRLGGTRPGEG